jgi:sulfite exporter TauE/SafE
MIALWLSVFTASLLGSLHCMAMCGGLAAVAATGPRRGRIDLLAHVGFNTGRLVGYATLGAVAGGVGAMVDLGGRAVGLGRIAATIAGVVIVAYGGLMLLEAVGVWRSRFGAPAIVTRVAASLLRLAPDAPWPRGFVLGVCATCLPCGWLYTFALAAAATGGVLAGALLMTVFWLGTVPALLLIGIGVDALGAPLRRHVPAVCAIALIVVGLVAVAGRTGVVPMGHPPAPIAGEAGAPGPHAGHR